jgi:hypothetical protein
MIPPSEISLDIEPSTSDANTDIVDDEVASNDPDLESALAESDKSESPQFAVPALPKRLNQPDDEQQPSSSKETEREKEPVSISSIKFMQFITFK